MTVYSNFTEVQKNLLWTSMSDRLIALFCFVDDFLGIFQKLLLPFVTKPNQKYPPVKKFAIWLTAMVTLSLFFFMSGHTDYKSYHTFLMTYHLHDFPNLPSYQNLLAGIHTVTPICLLLLQMITELFKGNTSPLAVKFADSTRLKVCENQRIQEHKVARWKAGRGKSSRGWFYGFKLHIVCDEWMKVLGFTFTSGNTDDRVGLEQMWEGICGLIVTDGGYVGADFQEKARSHGIFLFAAARANMKKLMTEWQHKLFKMRQAVERVFSVLKYRMGMETSLPRSLKWYATRYIVCLTVYQLKQYFKQGRTNGFPILNVA